jgi:hypothetical protein
MGIGMMTGYIGLFDSVYDYIYSSPIITHTSVHSHVFITFAW